ncbi:MAG: TMEM175 family protein [Nitrososphaeraceae archaeon]
MLLRSGRLIAFSDSVLVVAVVLLVYNLATLATAEPNAFQGQIFLYTLAAYVGSFIVVFLYWVVFTSLLEYIKDLDDIVVSLSLIFLILVTLTSWKCSRTTKTILLVLSAL